MSLDRIFDTAASGMTANNLRLNTTASNMANAEAASSSFEETYRARHVVLSPAADQMEDDSAQGVAVLGVVESEAPLDMRYEPNHPLANEEGYVYYPNVNVVEEMANMMSASRAYQVNVEMMNTAKDMVQRTLTLGD